MVAIQEGPGSWEPRKGLNIEKIIDKLLWRNNLGIFKKDF